MDISFKTPLGRFNYRVAGLIIHEGELLIMQDINQPYYYIPGGRVGLHEKSEEAILREIREELAIEVEIERFLWVNENFFTEEISSEKFHEICFFYLLNVKDSSLLENGNQFVVNEDGKVHTYRWVKFKELVNLPVYPSFLSEHLENLPSEIQHIIEIK